MAIAAGMSGGAAYVWDPDAELETRINRGGGSIQLEVVIEPDDITLLRGLVEKHAQVTCSERAQNILDNWDETLPQFANVVSTEYKRLVAEQRQPSQRNCSECVRVRRPAPPAGTRRLPSFASNPAEAG